MELSQVSKARNRKRNNRKGAQARFQQAARDNPGATAEQLADNMPPKTPARPRFVMPEPVKPRPVVSTSVPSGMTGRGKLALATGLLAAGGGGAYLYQRRRVEKSLSSSMQRDWPYMMMRST